MKLEEVKKGSYQHYIAPDFLSALFFNKRVPLVVEGIDESSAAAVKAKLLDYFGDIEVTALSGNDERAEKVSELDGSVSGIIVGASSVTECKRFDFNDFVQIMNRLRADDGCEWDRAQTHESIRINLIEEAYELVDAIDAKDAEMMREECGDVLMQAVFHTLIAEKNGEFDTADMLTVLCRKLIDRHTHIFGANHANNADEALVFWNEAKKKEKKYKSAADAMERVPKNMPALLYCEKIQKRASKENAYSESAESAIKAIKERLNLFANDERAARANAGELLFYTVSLLRLFGVETEMALKEACAEFLEQVAKNEKK